MNGGPYRLVRHPVYFAEIGVSVGLALQGDVHIFSTLILVPFICIQVARSVYEERVLRASFPEYPITPGALVGWSRS